MEQVLLLGTIKRTEATNLGENVKTKKTLNNQQILLVDAPFDCFGHKPKRATCQDVHARVLIRGLSSLHLVAVISDQQIQIAANEPAEGGFVCGLQCAMQTNKQNQH